MTTVPLGKIISATGGRAGADSGLPVYSVTKHHGFVPSLEYFKKQVFSREVESYKVVEAGDFAYATIHLDEGSIGIAPQRSLISPMYTVFRADPDQVDSSYLIRFLKSSRALAYYPQLGKGAIHRRKAISLDSLGGLPVPLPPLPEQRRIVQILSHAEGIGVMAQERMALLRQLEAAMLEEAVHGPVPELVRAGDIMPQLRNGVSPSASGVYPAQVLTLSAVTRGTFDAQATKLAMFSVEPPKDKRVTATDFMMCRGNGNIALVGAGVFAPRDRPDLVFPDTVIAGRVDTSRVLMSFLQAVWRRAETRRQIEAAARTTNGTYKVNQKTLSEVSIPVPSLEVQSLFAARAEVLKREEARSRELLAKNRDLVASIESRAFRGEL